MTSMRRVGGWFFACVLMEFGGVFTACAQTASIGSATTDQQADAQSDGRYDVDIAYTQVGQPSGQTSGAADTQDNTSTSSAFHQSRDNAWWTGPMLANSAETLPPGHFLVEPYLYDVMSSHSNGYGSRAYVEYGLLDRFTIGVIPVVGYNTVSDGPSSSRVRVGDITVQAQYRLTEFQEGSWFPTTAIQLQETLPTGKYDQLGDRPTDGVGAGTYTTTVGINSQTYFWMPNGHILRMRFNVSEAISRSTDVAGVSVYGTGANFRGNAKPGNGFYADLSWEYSLTRNWVLALDAVYSHESNTRIAGYDVFDSVDLPLSTSVRLNSGSSTAFGVAPAIEYNLSSTLGVLLGTRVIFGGHNSVASVTPAIAINYVY